MLPACSCFASYETINSCPQRSAAGGFRFRAQLHKFQMVFAHSRHLLRKKGASLPQLSKETGRIGAQELQGGLTRSEPLGEYLLPGVQQ